VWDLKRTEKLREEFIIFFHSQKKVIKILKYLKKNLQLENIKSLSDIINNDCCFKLHI